MAEEYEMGRYVGTIEFNLPAQEKKKLDTLFNQAPTMKKVFESFARGGAAFTTALTTVALLGSQGMRAILGTFKDLMGALLDVILAPFFPQMGEFLKKFAEFIKLVRNKGFFGALTDIGFWNGVGDLLKNSWQFAKDEVIPELVLGLKSVWQFVKDEVTPNLGGVIKDAWVWAKNLMGTLWDKILNMDNWENAGKWLGESLVKMWAWVHSFLLDPSTWTTLAKVLLDTAVFLISAASFIVGAVFSFVAGFISGMASAGVELARAFWEWIKDRIGPIIDFARGTGSVVSSRYSSIDSALGGILPGGSPFG